MQLGGIELKGVPIDLGTIKTPCYCIFIKEDHIAPRASTFRGGLRLGGLVRFVSGGSGHIAALINSPSLAKWV